MLFAPRRCAVRSSEVMTARLADVGLSKYAMTGEWSPMPQLIPHARHGTVPAYNPRPQT